MTDSGSRAKPKKDTVDWDRIKARFISLSELPGGIIASSTEEERILAVFNRALEQSKTGNSDVAMIALSKLTSRWPNFMAASTLYGVLLAEARRYAEAEKLFEQVLLQAPDSEDAKTIEYCRQAAREERIREEAHDRSQRSKEQKLLPVKARMARSGILTRAADDGKSGRTEMAGKKEQEDVLRMTGDYAPVNSPERKPVSRAVRVLAICVAAVSALFLIFYFAIRPGILAAEQRRTRLEWLEKQLISEESTDEHIADLLKQYKKYFSLDDDMQSKK